MVAAIEIHRGKHQRTSFPVFQLYIACSFIPPKGQEMPWEWWPMPETPAWKAEAAWNTLATSALESWTRLLLVNSRAAREPAQRRGKKESGRGMSQPEGQG